MRRLLRIFALTAIVLSLGHVMFAQDAPATEVVAEAAAAVVEAAPDPVAELTKSIADHKRLLDTLWVMLAAFLVFFMQAGFAYVEAGFTRAKNTNNIMMKNLMDFALGTLAFWAFGFAFMFGDGNGAADGNGAFIGLTGFFLQATEENVNEVYPGLSWANVPLAAKFMFQLVFAGTAATIVSGAMAERTKYNAYLVYSFIISAFCYPVVGHWIWGGGWLAGMGMWDFAGSSVVHSVGGWFALAGALVLGPRIGKYSPDGKPRAIPGHSIPMAALGVFILWLGWFGFNPGSTMAATELIGHIAVTTNAAAATGALAAMFTSLLLFKVYDIGMTLNGALAGLVGITAGCAFVTVEGALIIGILSGIAVVFAVVAIDKIGIDDPVGAVSVHGVCGALGTLLLGVFAVDAVQPGTAGDGLLAGGGAKLLIAQATGVVSVFAWSFGLGMILFLAIKYTIGLRVSAEEEAEGLDIAEHGIGAYPDPGFHQPPS